METAFLMDMGKIVLLFNPCILPFGIYTLKAAFDEYLFHFHFRRRLTAHFHSA